MQVQAHEVRKSTDLLAKVAEDIQARQRDMSRDVIEPTVQNSMTDGYAACCAEVGSGQFDRMRRLMRATVEHQKGSMFKKLQVYTTDGCCCCVCSQQLLCVYDEPPIGQQ